MGRDVPCFSGTVTAGTPILVLCRYFDAVGQELVNIKAGFVEIHGLAATSLHEKMPTDPF